MTNVPPPQPGRSPESDSNPEEGQESQENYSLDEIMRTLREGERQKEEKGEIVTRDDGTVARRVRRRKRRSEQPEKEAKDPKKEKKSLLVKVSLSVGVFLLFLLGSLFLLLAFNTKSYEEKLETRIGDWTGAETEFTKTTVFPGSISVEQADFNWPDASHLDTLHLRKLTGDVNVTSFLGGRLGGQGFGAKFGTLTLKSPTDSGDVGLDLEPGEFPFDFQRYYCEGLDVNFGKDGQARVKQGEVSLRHLPGEGFRITVGDGILQLKGWEDFSIDNGLIKFPSGELDVVSLRLQDPARAGKGLEHSILVAGKLSLTPGEVSQLEISSDNFPVNYLVGKDLGQFFLGSVRNVDGVVRYRMGSDQLDQVVLPFESDNLQLLRFPLLADLLRLFPETQDDEFVFSDGASGVFRWSPKGGAIENLKMTNKNLRMEGDILISSEGQLGGRFRVWISLGFINGDPKWKNHPGFARREGGFAVIDVKLGGTAEFPDDDFRVKTGIEPILDRGTEENVDSIDDLWKELTQPGE
ncbi:MAG: hypothetical protein ACSHYF_13175 [Verrucomicrobiaceae bacterium]